MKAWEMKRLSVTKLSSEDNLLTFTECSSHHLGALMTTGAFSQNVGKLFFKLKLVTDIYAETNWEATERLEKFYVRLF